MGSKRSGGRKKVGPQQQRAAVKWDKSGVSSKAARKQQAKKDRQAAKALRAHVKHGDEVRRPGVVALPNPF